MQIHRWLLVIACLAACGVPPKQPPASRADLEALYRAEKWDDCARAYERAGRAAQGKPRETHLYNAACCRARGGHADAAFALLDEIIKEGYRGATAMEHDADFASLHADPRWAGAVASVRATEATWEKSLGAPELRRELLAMEVRDQQTRAAMIKAGTPEATAATVELDRAHTARMREIVAQHGWPGVSLVGEDGAAAAWLLVQHADQDLAFQKECLAKLQLLLPTGEIARSHYAYLYDRIAVAEQRPQRYGTQFGPDRKLHPVEEPARLDARRADMGMPPMAEYEKMMTNVYGPPPAR